MQFTRRLPALHEKQDGRPSPLSKVDLYFLLFHGHFKGILGMLTSLYRGKDLFKGNENEQYILSFCRVLLPASLPPPSRRQLCRRTGRRHRPPCRPSGRAAPPRFTAPAAAKRGHRRRGHGRRARRVRRGGRARAATRSTHRGLGRGRAIKPRGPQRRSITPSTRPARVASGGAGRRSEPLRPPSWG